MDNLILLIAEISGTIYEAVVSLLLIKYYDSFLTLKSKKRFLSLACFGAVYFFTFYLNRLLFTAFDFGSFQELVGIFVYAGVINVMSLILFKKNFGMQIFLLFSFLAVRDISTTIINVADHLIIKSLFNILRFLENKLNLLSDVLFTIIANCLNSFIYSLIFVIVIALALKSISKVFVYKNYELRQSELLFLVLPCLSCLSVTNLIATILKLLEYSSLTVLRDSSTINILIIMTCLFFLLTIIASIKLLQKNIQLHIDEKNAAVLQTQMQQIQEQIRDVDSIYTEIRGMRHDLKNHLSNIQSLVTAVMEGNQDVSKELEEYLGKFGDTLNKFEFVYQTGNSVSDIIIHQKHLESLNKEINFSSDFIYPARLNLDVYDLAVILNNALENAIEACNSVSRTDRFVRVYSYIKGEMFFMEVENSFTERFTIDEDTALPVSKKDNKSLHGIGLSNVQRCARKYFGDIDFKVSEAKDYSIFRLTVMLQNKN